jgi:hypothetical protein
MQFLLSREILFNKSFNASCLAHLMSGKLRALTHRNRMLQSGEAEETATLPKLLDHHRIGSRIIPIENVVDMPQKQPIVKFP